MPGSDALIDSTAVLALHRHRRTSVSSGAKTIKRGLVFPAGQLPPAQFFWSATLYTLPDRLLYANPKNRYSIGDRTKGVISEAHRPREFTPLDQARQHKRSSRRTAG